MSELKQDLRAMVADGAAFSVMVGVGETYLPAFVLAVGLGQLAAGLVAAVPLLAGAILQLVSPWAIRKLKSNRSWVVCCAAVQAASFVPLLIAALVGAIPTWAVFMIASLYWGAGMATGPAWNSWAGTLVPVRIRARFFACRARLGQVCLLAGFLLGGISLQVGAWYERPLWAFAILFLIAGISRSLSAFFLSRQSEPEPPDDNLAAIPPREIWYRCRHTGDGRMLSYLVFAQVGVQISGPYFTPYMLCQLDFSYAAYVTLLATALVAKIVVLSFLGGFTQRYGARVLLWVGAIAIVPISSLWLLGSSFEYLLCVQMLSGVAWGVFELASFLVFFESIKPAERTSLLTAFNVGNAGAIVIGSLLGGALLQLFGAHQTTYLVLFGLSSLFRGGALTLLWAAHRAEVHDHRHLPEIDGAPVQTRILSVRPDTGGMARPILVTLTNQQGPQSLATQQEALPQPAEVAAPLPQVDDEPASPVVARPKRERTKSLVGR